MSYMFQKRDEELRRHRARLNSEGKPQIGEKLSELESAEIGQRDALSMPCLWEYRVPLSLSAVETQYANDINVSLFVYRSSLSIIES